jgi:hypothetical protein
LKRLMAHNSRSRIAPAEPVSNLDEVTVQELKKALDNPSLGIKVIDVCKTNEHEIAKVAGVTLLPGSRVKCSFPWHGGMQFPPSIWQFRVSPVARSVV